MKDRRMARLGIRNIAESKGLNMSQLQRQSGLTMGVVRRYWYNTANGLADGDPLEMISLEHINTIAEVLKVNPGELLLPPQEDEEA